MVLSVNGKTTVFGVTSWGFDIGPNGMCDLGSAYTTFEPVGLDFLAYQTACPMVPRAGSCDGATTAVRCITPPEGGYRITTTDCSQLGQMCGFDESGAIGCVDDPCAGLPAEGLCDGDVATRCTHPNEGERRVVSTDCSALGGTCGIQNGEVACISVGCAHEVCDQGTTLTPECSTCAASICAVDPFCCETGWDAFCVGEVQSVCNETCPGAQTAPAANALKQHGIRPSTRR
jgi:hypothetical protein